MWARSTTGLQCDTSYFNFFHLRPEQREFEPSRLRAELHLKADQSIGEGIEADPHQHTDLAAEPQASRATSWNDRERVASWIARQAETSGANTQGEGSREEAHTRMAELRDVKEHLRALQGVIMQQLKRRYAPTGFHREGAERAEHVEHLEPDVQDARETFHVGRALGTFKKRSRDGYVGT